MGLPMPVNYLSICTSLVFTLSYTPSPQVRAKEQRVQFDRGKDSTMLKGTTPKPDEGDFDQYLLNARKGQMLRVRLQTADAKAYLIVYSMGMSPPDGCVSCGRGGFSRHTKLPPPLRNWSGRLPVSGDYSIQVYTEAKGGEPYALRLSIR